MMTSDITCARCGWRNEATARMCGGCGQPLRQQPDSPATIAVPGAGWMPNPEPGATTPVDIAAPYAPPLGAPIAGSQTPPLAHEAATSIWPGGEVARRAAPKSSARKNPWRVPTTIAIVLCVLLVLILGAWAIMLRPAIHSTVDSQLRAALDTAIVQAAPNQPIPAGIVLTITIPASTLNTDIQNELGNVPVQNVQVHFSGDGQVLAGYTFLGRDGTISTQLVPLADGRVQAQGTAVTGLLGMVESDDEMAAAFNEALGRLPTQYHVNTITAANDILTISVSGQ